MLRCSLTSLVSSQAANEMRVSCGLAAPPGPLLVDGPKGLPGREGLAPSPYPGYHWRVPRQWVGTHKTEGC